MKPKSGDKVVCIAENGWWLNTWWNNFKAKFLGHDTSCDGPDKGDVCTIREVSFSEGQRWYALEEWPDDDYAPFPADCFKPIVNDSITNEEEESIEREIKEALSAKY